MYLWWFRSEGVAALRFLLVLDRGIVAGRMVASVLFSIEHNLARRFYHRCWNWSLAFRGPLINCFRDDAERKSSDPASVSEAGFFFRGD
jgi:hypothetical protein